MWSRLKASIQHVLVLIHLYHLTNFHLVECTHNSAYLIDNRFSTIISNELGDNYFGASASLYQSTDEKSIFIGAPRANTSGLQRGNVWKCTTKYEEESNQILCQPLEAEKTISQNRYGKTWFGGSIISVDGGPVIGAHHFISQKSGSANGMPGVCFLYKDTKENDKFLTFNVPEEYLDKQPVKMAGFGFSLHKVTGSEILAGAPVFHYGAGAIGRIHIDGAKSTISWIPSEEVSDGYFGYAVSSGNYFRDGKNYYAGGLPRQNNLKGKVTVFTTSACPNPNKEPCVVKLKEQTSMFGFHVGSYFGSAIFSQDIDDDGIDELFVGAPMSCYWDDVTQIQNYNESMDSENSDLPKFNRNYRDNGCVYVYKLGTDDNLEVVQILMGNKSPYARFGSSISTLEDYKSFGSKVIVVGAPYEDNNGGAVYFYEGSQILKTGEYMKRIAADEKLFSILPRKFQGLGYSLSHSMDIDGNETPDITVGSFRSGQALVLRTRQNMILSPTDIWFKFSDMPRDNPPASDVKELGTNKKQFRLGVTVNCTFTVTDGTLFGKILDQQPGLVIWTRLKVDEAFRRFKVTMETDQIPYANLDGQSIEFGTDIKKILPAPVPARLFGVSAVVRVDYIGGDYSDTLTDIPPLKITAESWFNQSADLIPNIISYDVRDNSKGAQFEHNQTNSFRRFLPAPTKNQLRTFGPFAIEDKCRIADACEANITISNASFYVIRSGKHQRVESLALGSAPEVFLKWELVNVGVERGDSPSTRLEWNHEDMMLVSDNCKPFNIPGPGQMISWCNITGSLLPSGKKGISQEAKFQLRGKYFKTRIYRDLTVKMGTNFVTSASIQVYNMQTVTLGLLVDSKVILRGTSVETSIERLTIPAKIGYQVLLNGPSSVQKISLKFFMPKRRPTDAENLVEFYQEEVKTISGGYKNYQCTTSEPFYGVISTTTPESPSSWTTQPAINDNSTARPGDETTPNPYIDAGRRKRETPEQTWPSRLNFTINSTILMNCNGDQRNCFNVLCAFENVEAATNLKIEFRVNVRNHTLTLLNDTLDTILIASTGAAEIFNDPSSGNMSEVKIIKGKEIIPVPPPIWIYIVAILGGLILLIVILAVLYKCGFFKRDFKEKLDELKQKTEGDSAPIRTDNEGDLPLKEGDSSERLLEE